MRDMEKLRLQKKNLAQCLKIQAMIEEIRDRRSAWQQFLKEKETLIDELSSGLKRVVTAISLNCHTTDIVDEEYIYELPIQDIAGIDVSDYTKNYNVIISTLLGRIVGKGGAHIHSIETQHKVSIDIHPLPPGGSGDALEPIVKLQVVMMGNRLQPLSIEQGYAAVVAKIESVRDTAIEQVLCE